MSVVAPRSVEAIIVDDAGALVAQRTLTERSSPDKSAKVCLPLARAVGAWASLVLDAELARAKDDDGSEPTPARDGSTAAATSPPVVVPAGSRLGVAAADVRDRGASSNGEGEAPAKHSIEIGTMVYLQNGMTVAGGFGGVSPFMTVEVAPSWVLRPALAFGRSTTPIPVSTNASAMMSHVGARADFCRRIPGNYTERRGIEADLCLGLEGGVITDDPRTDVRGNAAARLGLGPSMNLRGELGAGIALEVRALVGANLLNRPLVDEAVAPLVFAAAELGVSVRLP